MKLKSIVITLAISSTILAGINIASFMQIKQNEQRQVEYQTQIKEQQEQQEQTIQQEQIEDPEPDYSDGYWNTDGDIPEEEYNKYDINKDGVLDEQDDWDDCPDEYTVNY